MTIERRLSLVDKTIRQLTCFFSRGFNISRLLQKLINGLVSIETVGRQMKGEKFDIKRVDKGQIPAVRGVQSRCFAR